MFSQTIPFQVTQTVILTFLNFSTTLLLRRFCIHFIGAETSGKMKNVGKMKDGNGKLVYNYAEKKIWRMKGMCGGGMKDPVTLNFLDEYPAKNPKKNWKKVKQIAW